MTSTVLKPPHTSERPKKKLTFLLPNLPLINKGGIEVNTLRLSKGFSEQGWDVDIVITGSRKEPISDVPFDVRLVNLNVARGISSLLPFARYLRTEQPSVIISARPLMNCIAIWARYISKTSSLVTLTERGLLSSVISNSKEWKMRLMPHIMRFTYPKADAIIAVSHGVADDLCQVLNIKRNRVDVIYNPIFSEDIIEKSRKNISHSWLSLDQPPVILSAGRFVDDKDFETLIYAFYELKKIHTARLMILGDGPNRAHMEKLADHLNIRSEVSMPGFIDNPYPYMRAAGVFVLPSRYEGFGNVLVEAMACGTPVVSTSCAGGPSEILEGGKWGELVRAGDYKEMCNAICRSLAQPRNRAVERAAFFSVANAVSRYTETIGLTA